MVEVKYDQFVHLCREQWLKEYKGDVIGLHLTDSSARDLEIDIKWFGIVRYYCNPLENPVTRSSVRVISGAEHDIAVVSHGQLGEPDYVPL